MWYAGRLIVNVTMKAVQSLSMASFDYESDGTFYIFLLNGGGLSHVHNGCAASGDAANPFHPESG